MEVALDVSAVPMTDEQMEALAAAHLELVKQDINGDQRESAAVGTSLAFREQKRFILPGDAQEYKEYESAQEMIADQPPLPDPIFGPDEVVPMVWDAGAQLAFLDKHDENFKEMIKEMFDAGTQIKLTNDAIEELIAKR